MKQYCQLKNYKMNESYYLCKLRDNQLSFICKEWDQISNTSNDLDRFSDQYKAKMFLNFYKKIPKLKEDLEFYVQNFISDEYVILFDLIISVNDGQKGLSWHTDYQSGDFIKNRKIMTIWIPLIDINQETGGGISVVKNDKINQLVLNEILIDWNNEIKKNKEVNFDDFSRIRNNIIDKYKKEINNNKFDYSNLEAGQIIHFNNSYLHKTIPIKKNFTRTAYIVRLAKKSAEFNLEAVKRLLYLGGDFFKTVYKNQFRTVEDYDNYINQNCY